MAHGHPGERLLRVGDKDVRVRALSDRQLVVSTTMLDPDAQASDRHDDRPPGQAQRKQAAPGATTGMAYELRVEVRRVDDCEKSEIVEALDGWAIQYDCMTFDRDPSDAMLDDACDFAVRALAAIAPWANSSADGAVSPAASTARADGDTGDGR